MKYDNDFKIGFIRCKCGKSLIVKRKSFLGFKYFKGTCRHCNTKVRIRRIKKEKLIAKIIIEIHFINWVAYIIVTYFYPFSLCYTI